MLPFKRILCPTDFSEPSMAALKAGGELGVHFSSEVLLVHVIPPIPGLAIRPGRITKSDLPPHRHKLLESATRQLEEIHARMLPGEASVREMVAYGPPADEVTRIADEEDVDLIVIATHGQTGWRELVFGSVAEKVIQLAHCAVLCIRASPGNA
jgi:nucleotide-binding universal stress UspA family protein